MTGLRGQTPGDGLRGQTPGDGLRGETPKPGGLPKSAAAEALAVWALCFGGILVSYLVYQPAAKIVATLGFLYLPLWAGERRGDDYPELGITFRAWKKDLTLFAICFAIIVPVFTLGYVAYGELLTRIPESLRGLLAPYVKAPHFEPRLPADFSKWVVDNLFVVALPEEFFYRGYLQTRLRDAWPKGRLFFGVRLGPAFWVTAILFALGHLAIFQVWRLGVFFPALLFGFLREKTGTVMGAALLHACCNLLMLVLEASFYGR